MRGRAPQPVTAEGAVQHRHQRGADRGGPEQLACRLGRAAQCRPQRTGGPAAETGPADAVINGGRPMHTPTVARAMFTPERGCCGCRRLRRDSIHSRLPE
ncbi:hypothetical protein G6F64_014597 [Rhizopus arrhizus]|uniref:Uncharacterized protein n=1 Tax=Rhizopus oryzae TaxID=64495 RepID=A0A9P7BJF5_RHIOR|nr:hypothetical protein G6F23_015296 [Rhizopus arrhizus]KAG1279152.1 hypothetical protein G6F64_014597 [Rhizopus arrhizus]